jgi:hypothetical protein
MTRRQRNLAVTAPVEDEPLPPSHARRWTIGLLVLIALLIGTRLWWGRIAERRLQAAIDDRRARGEPVTEADFAEPQLPDEQNAAFYLERAAALGRQLGRVEPTLPEIQRARSAKGVSWHLGNARTYDQALDQLRVYSELRALTDALVAAARQAHAEGNDRMAVEYLDGGVFIGRTLERASGVVSYLSANQLVTNAAEGSSALAAELRVGNAPPAASREQVEHLIRELFDGDGTRNALVRALQYDRVGASGPPVPFTWYRAEPDPDGNLHPVPSPAWVNRPATIMFGPYATLHSALVLRRSIPAADAARGVDGAGPWISLPPTTPRADTELPVVDAVASLFNENDANRILGVYTQLRGLHTAAATDLAARLFEIDHGRQPNSVNELVPNYLPAMTRYVPKLAPTTTTMAATRPATAPARNRLPPTIFRSPR